MQRSCEIVFLLLATATAAPALTLEEAIARARAHHPSLAVARQRVEAAAGRAEQARLWSNPELELSAEEVPVDHGGVSRAQNMIGVAQTIPFPGKKALDVQIGRREIHVSEWEYHARERDVVRAVKGAFYRALAAQHKASVAAELVALSRALVEAARQRIAAGAAGEPERLRAEIELERAAVELNVAQRELAEARLTLAVAMGQPREVDAQLDGELRTQAPVINVDRVGARLLAEHPLLCGSAAARERAELELRRARMESLPDVRVGIAGGRDFAERETRMEFRVSLPLPLIDRAQGRQREARALATAARHETATIEQQLWSELQQVVARLRAAGEQVEAYRSRMMPRASEALKLAQTAYAAGKLGFLDLMDTQRTVAELRLAYWDKLLELNLALADIEALAGNLDLEE